MSLGDDLKKMSLKGSSEQKDPAGDASKKGNVPTLGDVKKSIKVHLHVKINTSCDADLVIYVYSS